MKKKKLYIKILSAVLIAASSVIYVSGTEATTDAILYPLTTEETIALEENKALIEKKHLAEGELLDVNTADATQFELLPGIGPVKAAAIVEYREKNGRFESIGEIINVPGIGPSLFEKISPMICAGGEDDI